MKQPFHQSLMGNSSSEAWKSGIVPIGSNYKLVFSSPTNGGPSHMARHKRTKKMMEKLLRSSRLYLDWRVLDRFANPNGRRFIFQPDFKV